MDKNNTLPKEIEVNNKVYSVIKLLGKGKGGYSYLVIRDDKKYVLKQIHHEPCDYYNFGNKIEAELNDYKRLLALGIPLPLMIEVDISKERILKEFIDGLTADELIKRNNLPNYCIEQVEEMCKLLYAENLNIDYYPTNFVLQNGKLFYIDYECNEYSDKWNFENWGKQYWII